MSGEKNMIQLLLNKTNFDGRWAAETLFTLFHENQKVLIIPLSQKTGWASDYEDYTNKFEQGSEYHADLIRPFLRYGIPKRNIRILNHFDYDEDSLSRLINNYDVVCFSAEEALDAYNCLLDLNILNVLSNYDGISIFLSGAASVLSEYFPVYDDDYETFITYDGFNYIEGVDLVMDYQETDEYLKYIIETIEDRNRKVLICPKDGGVLLTDTSTELLGSAFIADQNDLDEIYRLYRE